MPLGIQRIDGGRLASIAMPPVSSARLHSAIACTVPMWLVTARRWRRLATQRLGYSSSMRGRMLAKKGALQLTARAISQWLEGQRERRRQRGRRSVGRRVGTEVVRASKYRGTQYQ